MSRFIIFDIEIFPNWWCVCYKEPGKSVQSVTSDDYRGWETLSKLRIGNVLIGFNIKNYDLKILYAIVNGATCERLYKLSKSHFMSFRMFCHAKIQKLIDICKFI